MWDLHHFRLSFKQSYFEGYIISRNDVILYPNLMIMKMYHNPSCSKSRICLEFLQAEKKDFELVTYIKKPLTKEDLTALLSKLDMKPSELVRKNEMIFKEAGKSHVLSEEEILQLMLENPKLIERPIVEVDGKAIVVRPIERLKAFLQY